MEVETIQGNLCSLMTYKDWIKAHQSDLLWKYNYKGNISDIEKSTEDVDDQNNVNYDEDEEKTFTNFERKCSEYVEDQGVNDGDGDIFENLYSDYEEICVESSVLDDARNKGLEPCTLGDVLLKRSKFWAKTQLIHDTAREDYNNYTNLYKSQFESYNKSADGWVDASIHKDRFSKIIQSTCPRNRDGKVWSNVIFCPNFKPGGEIVHRFSRKSVKLYKTLYNCLVKGWVNPGLVVCEIMDATHPVRFATPPDQDCYTAIYAGPEISASSSQRVIFGEYTGVVFREDCISDSVFEYAFELAFSPASWVNAEFDLSNEQCGKKDVNGCVYLPSNTRFVLDSSSACNELSLVNHCQSIRGYGGEFWVQPNCEWQEVIFDGWPHVVLTSKSGVKISPGDELVADFGALWFSKVEENAHRSLRRELIEYRIGLRSVIAKDQKIVKERSLDDTDSRIASMNASTYVCAICLDQNLDENIGDVDRDEECICCDGCDRIFHLKCLNDLNDIAVNHFVRDIDGQVSWETENNIYKNGVNLNLGKWFCCFCRNLAKQIYLHDIGADYMPLAKNIDVKRIKKKGNLQRMKLNKRFTPLELIAELNDKRDQLQEERNIHFNRTNPNPDANLEGNVANGTTHNSDLLLNTPMGLFSPREPNSLDTLAPRRDQSCINNLNMLQVKEMEAIFEKVQDSFPMVYNKLVEDKDFDISSFNSLVNHSALLIPPASMQLRSSKGMEAKENFGREIGNQYKKDEPLFDPSLNDYLTCRYLAGMWQLEPFAQFGDSLRACVDCHKHSGPKANIYVCRVLKRHLGGNYDHPQNTGPSQIQELVLMAYEQHVHFLLRLLVLKNIAIEFMVKLCCHFIGKQLFYYRRDLQPSLPFPSDFLGSNHSRKDININPSIFINEEYFSKRFSNKKPGEKDRKLLRSHLTSFVNAISNTLSSTPQLDSVMNYELLKAMGAFTEEYTRLSNCNELVRYLNDLMVYMSYNGDQVPGQIQQMLSKDEIDRFSLFRHLSKPSSAFSQQSVILPACKPNGSGTKRGRQSKNYNGTFIPLLGILPGKTAIYRKFSDGYYQGTLQLPWESEICSYISPSSIRYDLREYQPRRGKYRHTFTMEEGVRYTARIPICTVYFPLIHNSFAGIIVGCHEYDGVYTSFKVEYSDGDDETMQSDDLIEELIMNLRTAERIVSELSPNDVRNEQLMRHLGYSNDMSGTKQVANRLRESLLGSLMSPRLYTTREYNDILSNKKIKIFDRDIGVRLNRDDTVPF